MRTRSVIVYTVLRLLAFLVPFGILMLFPIFQDFAWLAAVFAAIIGLSLSMIFLRRPLSDVSAGLAERRARHKKTSYEAEAELEDAANETLQPHDQPQARPRNGD